MIIIKYPPRDKWNEILQRPSFENSRLENTVLEIFEKVKLEGNEAIQYFSKKFDKVDIKNLMVEESEIIEAENNISKDLKDAIKLAKANIEKFHNSQREKDQVVETTKGVNCWRKSVAIEKVGLYIPGGSAPLFSTVLMLGIPARIAGCNEIILCTPPDKNGKINAAILYTAKLVGITKIFKVGGAQAIAAMAFGTATIPKVYKIFGPGNQYVTCAKMLANKMGLAIDMPAGPSELCVIADESCDASFVAADLLSQAEHGVDSQVVLVSTNEAVIENIIAEINNQKELLSRKKIINESLGNSIAILVASVEEGIDLVNEYAPEHLIVVSNYEDIVIQKIINAGSVFIGNYSCESAGDYASGTNHTLPTNGYAKSYSGVSLDSFCKKITFQKISFDGLKNIGPSIEIMALAEGLDAHKNAVTIRLKK